MNKIFILLFLLSNFAFADNFKAEQKECVSLLKPFKKESWCFSSERKECLNNNGGAEWCDSEVLISAESEVLEQKLDKTYASVIDSFEKNEGISVSHSQEAWREYVFAECEARAEMLHIGAGILKRNTLQDCINEFYQQRIEDLNHQYCQNKNGC